MLETIQIQEEGKVPLPLKVAYEVNLRMEVAVHHYKNQNQTTTKYLTSNV
jgi:hypothetical protein